MSNIVDLGVVTCHSQITIVIVINIWLVDWVPEIWISEQQNAVSNQVINHTDWNVCSL